MTYKFAPIYQSILFLDKLNPPEKLLFNKPESYNRNLLTNDIEGIINLIKIFSKVHKQEKIISSLKFTEML